MARIADPTSKRQRAFTLIEQHPGVKRAQMLPVLMKKLDVSEGYANTLFENYRRILKNSGEYVPTFIIRDVRNGYNVDPYVSSKNVSRHEVTKDTPNTIKKAITVYYKKLSERRAIAKELGNDTSED